MSISLQGGVNFRDLGGYRVADGRTVKRGFLFRSGALDSLTAADMVELASLPVTHVLDYRDTAEAAQRPDALWTGVDYRCVPANPGYWGGDGQGKKDGASLQQLLSQATDAAKAFEVMRGLYQRLPFGNPAYRQMFACLQPTGADEPPRLVQHCAIGKDRTGVGSALLLLALGAPRATVVEDYLRTEETLAPFRDSLLATRDTQKMGMQYEALVCVLSAQEDFIVAALNAIESRYGDARVYLEQEFGLDEAAQQALQSRYLTA